MTCDATPWASRHSCPAGLGSISTPGPWRSGFAAAAIAVVVSGALPAFRAATRRRSDERAFGWRPRLHRRRSFSAHPGERRRGRGEHDVRPTNRRNPRSCEVSLGTWSSTTPGRRIDHTLVMQSEAPHRVHLTRRKSAFDLYRRLDVQLLSVPVIRAGGICTTNPPATSIRPTLQIPGRAPAPRNTSPAAA